MLCVHSSSSSVDKSSMWVYCATRIKMCIVCNIHTVKHDLLFSGGEMGSVALAVLLATSPLLKSLTIVAYQILSDSSDVVGPLNLEELKLIKYVYYVDMLSPKLNDMCDCRCEFAYPRGSRCQDSCKLHSRHIALFALPLLRAHAHSRQ